MGVLGAAWLAHVVPVSPAAIWRADAWVVAGDTAAALDVYDDVATWCPIPAVRRIALARAASVLAVELKEPAAAAERWKRVAALTEGADRAEALARAGEQLAAQALDSRFDRAAEIAELFERAGLLAGETGADWLAQAATWQERAGDLPAAEALWERVRGLGEGGRAELGLGKMWLAAGRVELALEAFDRASTDADVGVAAALGLEACRERLGKLEDALADRGAGPRMGNR